MFNVYLEIFLILLMFYNSLPKQFPGIKSFTVKDFAVKKFYHKNFSRKNFCRKKFYRKKLLP